MAFLETEKLPVSDEATYVEFDFEAKPEVIAELERIYRITDSILKFITVRKED